MASSRDSYKGYVINHEPKKPEQINTPEDKRWAAERVRRRRNAEDILLAKELGISVQDLL